MFNIESLKFIAYLKIQFVRLVGKVDDVDFALDYLTSDDFWLATDYNQLID